MRSPQPCFNQIFNLVYAQWLKKLNWAECRVWWVWKWYAGNDEILHLFNALSSSISENWFAGLWSASELLSISFVAVMRDSSFAQWLEILFKLLWKVIFHGKPISNNHLRFHSVIPSESSICGLCWVSCIIDFRNSVQARLEISLFCRISFMLEMHYSLKPMSGEECEFESINVA